MAVGWVGNCAWAARATRAAVSPVESQTRWISIGWVRVTAVSGGCGRGRPAIAGARSRRRATGGGWRARDGSSAITRTASKNASTGGPRRAASRSAAAKSPAATARGERLAHAGDGVGQRALGRVLERRRVELRRRLAGALGEPVRAGERGVRAGEVVRRRAAAASARARRSCTSGSPGSAPASGADDVDRHAVALQQRRRRGRARTAPRGPPSRRRRRPGRRPARRAARGPGRTRASRSSGQPRSRAISTTPAAARRRRVRVARAGRPLADREAGHQRVELVGQREHRAGRAGGRRRRRRRRAGTARRWPGRRRAGRPARAGVLRADLALQLGELRRPSPTPGRPSPAAPPRGRARRRRRPAPRPAAARRRARGCAPCGRPASRRGRGT